MLAPQKFENTPNETEANYLLVSMHDIDDIKKCLLGFRTFDSKEQTKKQPGCSATLIWSGTEGNNVPVSVFSNRCTGFVLNPKKITVPQADLIAYGSKGLIAEEYEKKGSLQYSNFEPPYPRKTKYPNKKGYNRTCIYTTVFATNLARNEHVGEQESIYP